MNIFPRLVVLPILHNGNIDGAKPVADGLKVRAITAVAAVVDFAFRRDKQKAGPQRLVALQPTAGEVTGGQNIDAKRIADLHALLPVRLLNLRRVHPPVTQMGADAEWRNNPFDLRHQRLDGGVIEVVIVVMIQFSSRVATTSAISIAKAFCGSR